ncbi:MAG: cobalamin-dependent protein [Oligoflexia bacterium]|nr:cobalamin-dependent protein [Oligoflexia bacterium]
MINKNFIFSSDKIIKIVLLRPPRHYWPILNESDNFLLPLAYPTLSSYLKKYRKDVEIIIHDCCSNRTGWQKLKKKLIEWQPDILGIGEKTPFAHEAFKAFNLCKQSNPNIITIAGGQHFSFDAEKTLKENNDIDFIIRFEGEIPFLELIKSLKGEVSIEKVPNLVYRDYNNNSKIVENKSIALINDLSSLPIPDYENSSLHLYSPFGLLWPKAATIQSSRGCIDNCHFCCWVALESSHSYTENGEIVRTPTYRHKTAEQIIHEIEILYEKFNIRYLFWVDGTWNAKSDLCNTVCEEIIRRKYKLGWWAFVRKDLLIQQHKEGVLKNMVKAGLRHVLCGGERPYITDINSLGKHNYNYQIAKDAMSILKKHHPEVFRQCTFITGLPDDNAEKIKAILSFAHDIDVDFAAFHVLTPYLGTTLRQNILKDIEQGKLNFEIESDYSKYDMFCPVMPTKYLTKNEVAYWTHWCQKNFVFKKPHRYFFRLFSPHTIRRKLHWWFLFSISRVFAKQITMHLQGQETFEGFAGINKLWRPSWYDE